MSTELDAVELQRWQAWKAATERVWDQVTRDITAATGLSSADFSVLTRVVELGAGQLRQQQLADDLGWQRARLSRQVSRMVERGLLEREVAHGGRLITATTEGRRRTRAARKAHAGAVRAALLEVAGGEPSRFWSTVELLGCRDREATPPPAT